MCMKCVNLCLNFKFFKRWIQKFDLRERGRSLKRGLISDPRQSLLRVQMQTPLTGSSVCRCDTSARFSDSPNWPTPTPLHRRVIFTYYRRTFHVSIWAFVRVRSSHERREGFSCSSRRILRLLSIRDFFGVGRVVVRSDRAWSRLL